MFVQREKGGGGGGGGGGDEGEKTSSCNHMYVFRPYVTKPWSIAFSFFIEILLIPLPTGANSHKFCSVVLEDK